MIKQILFFLEILKGLWITARHFLVNIFYNALVLLKIIKEKRGSVTIQYPEEKKLLYPRLRAMHRLTLRPNGKPRCVACYLCATVCPSECIMIEAGEYPDDPIQKYPTSFEIDLGKCCWCGFCVEACPEDAIRMDYHNLDFAGYSRQSIILNLSSLLKN